MKRRTLPSPYRARAVQLRRIRPYGRVLMTYDGKAAPFPVVVQPRLRGVRLVGVTLAEGLREGA